MPKELQTKSIETLSLNYGMPEQIIEKDWWVSTVMRALFALPYANQMSFKGGTSLSKCWNVISRFSEDIDIAVNRGYLGYGGELSRTQVSDKLRRAACTFVRERLQNDLRDKMIEQGIPSDKFSIEVNITSISTVDPEVINVRYDSLYPMLSYIRNAVKIEVSGRSMSEPLENVQLRSMIEDAFPNTQFAEAKFNVPTVKPERTFLEKVCLLHEEFSKEVAEVRETFPKNELIKTHTARRTGATLMYLAGMDIYDIMKITGHTSPAVLKKYIRADELQVVDKIKGKYNHFD